ncbi:hypothetical protein GE21DRAFT_1291352 [Neurospora crassa]|nr:hypothetical protein GE21DRAFT_1291352 [Neurospora crassa]
MTPFACLSVVLVLGNIKCYLPLCWYYLGTTLQFQTAITNSTSMCMQDITFHTA